MKYKLINKPNDKFSTIEQILFNRGISEKDIPAYLHTSDDVINNYSLLGDNIRIAAEVLKAAIDDNATMFVPIDSDYDGYSSAALFLNYLYNVVPTYVENNVTWWHHESKQHGLKDCIDLAKTFDIVVCLDAASNDYEEHKILREKGIPVICCDHHEAEKISEDAIVINNQLSDYPNKSFSGVGITWQFCRYLDEHIFHTNHAEKYYDLVAIGLGRLG